MERVPSPTKEARDDDYKLKQKHDGTDNNKNNNQTTSTTTKELQPAFNLQDIGTLDTTQPRHPPPPRTMDRQSPVVEDPVLPLDWCPIILRQIVVLILVRGVEVHVQHLVPDLQAVRPYLHSKWVMLVN